MKLVAIALPASAAELDWSHVEVSRIGGLVDGDPHLRSLALADSKPASLVAYCHEGVKARHLAGVGLLLHDADVDHLALDVRQEVLDNFRFLYPHAVFVNLIHRVYFACQHHASKRGSGLPFCLLLLTRRKSAHFFLPPFFSADFLASFFSVFASFLGAFSSFSFGAFFSSLAAAVVAFFFSLPVVAGASAFFSSSSSSAFFGFGSAALSSPEILLLTSSK